MKRKRRQLNFGPGAGGFGMSAIGGNGSIGGPGINLGAGGGLPWYSSGAVEIDMIANRYAYGGVTYGSIEDLFAVLNGASGSASIAAGKVQVGNYKTPGITNLILDGAPPDGTDKFGFTQSSGGPATGLATGGEFQLSGNGSTNAAVAQLFPTEASNGYEATIEVARGTGSTAGPKLVIGSAALLGSATTQSGQAPSTAWVASARNFASMSAFEALYAGMVSQGSALGGFNRFRNLAVKACWPFLGFSVGGVSLKILCQIPADTTGTTVLLNFDANEVNASLTAPYERNYCRLAVVSGRMRLQIVYHSTQNTVATACNLDLGPVTAGELRVITMAATTNLAAAVMDGAGSLGLVTAPIVYMPGLTHMRLHGPQPGSTAKNWDNTNTWLTFNLDFTLVPGTSLAFYFLEGDSYAAGYKPYLQTLSGRGVYGYPIGGSTMSLIAARCLTYKDSYRDFGGFIHDGDANGHETDPADELAKLKTIRDAWRQPIIVAAPMKRYNTLSDNAWREQYRLAIGAEFGANAIDVHGIAQSLSSGSADDLADVAAGNCPRSLFPDDVHPGPTLRNAILSAFISRANALGL